VEQKDKKKVNLALQGGGAHGAFAWGVLDKFLEKDIFSIEAITATSAGSMNAVILSQGMMEGGNEGARELLYEFWHAMSDYGKLYGVTSPLPIDIFLQPYLKVPVSFYFFSSITNILSPYQFNPYNHHPIREVLENIIDIEKIKANSKIKLFLGATNVRTGKIRIFNTEELSINAIIASACLPKLFQAVEIDNEYYWDGGYLGNPAIFPLIYNTDVKDIIILHTVPIVRSNIPSTVMEIETRLREISFNSSLMREMRAIAFVTKLIDDGWIKSEFKNNLKKLFIHCLRADKALEQFPRESVFVPDWKFLLTLRDLGRAAAETWLQENYDMIGKQSTIDFNEWL
jgi:NTE family protein